MKMRDNERLAEQFVPDVPSWTLPDVRITDVSRRPSINSVLYVLRQRSWLWACHARMPVKLRVLKRVFMVQRFFLPGLIQRFSMKVSIPGSRIISVYITGSFPWVHSPNDVDVVFLLDTHFPFNKINMSPGVAWRAFFPSVRNIDIEYVGLSTLQGAVRGEDAKKKVIIRRKALSYWGAVYLGGQDCFANTYPPMESFSVLVNDLDVDSQFARWPELKNAPRRMVKKKQKWRATEVRALERWIETTLLIQRGG